MSFLDLALARRSVRAFLPDALPQETVLALLEAARYAPSAGNGQSWHFYVVQNPALAARLRADAVRQDMVTQAPLLVVICADLTRAGTKYGARGETLYCYQDTAAAMQNLLLCAHDLGLGGCWLGAFDEAGVSAVLDIPSHFRPVGIAAVGKPETVPAPRRRRDLSEVATFLGP